MPIDAEFEEKEYEFPLYFQLAQGSTQVWPPGQVFEGYLGIDAGLMVNTAKIWRKLGYPAPFRGVILDDMRWGFIWRRRGARRRLPDFSLNMFIQAKRPHRMIRRNPAMVQCGLNRPCYRFKTRSHQQKALERLHRRLKNRALVVYACPVSTELDWLYDHIENGTLIDNSTYPKAINLHSHKAWAFDSAGASGLCCSEPEKIEDKGLLESIELLCSAWNSREKAWENPNTSLSELAGHIPAVIKNTKRSSFMKKYLKRIDELFDNIDHEFAHIARDYTKVAFFCRIYDLNWFVLGGRN
jgi:hypothetical protein